ncbi:MAG: cytochrome c oxidase subunit 3 [Nitrospiraceae bacterium]|nr:cytochrome c oxidase subunit 3 [Nitrospiraceae bacterium]
MAVRAEAGQKAVTARYGMWFFLYTEFILFGMLFLLYSVFRYRFPADFHAGAMEENILTGSVNTAVLLTSSLTMALAISAVKKGNNRLSAGLQLLTMALGIGFLCIKAYEWYVKIVKGLYPGSPVLLKMHPGEIIYFGLYYTMTGLHGLHLFAGVAVTAYMFYFTIKGRISADNCARLENTGLYWHFVDMVWMFLFPLFYLIT